MTAGQHGKMWKQFGEIDHGYVWRSSVTAPWEIEVRETGDKMGFEYKCVTQDGSLRIVPLTLDEKIAGAKADLAKLEAKKAEQSRTVGLKLAEDFVSLRQPIGTEAMSVRVGNKLVTSALGWSAGELMESLRMQLSARVNAALADQKQEIVDHLMTCGHHNASGRVAELKP